MDSAAPGFKDYFESLKANRLLMDGSMGKYLDVKYNVTRGKTTWILSAIIDPENHKWVVKAHQDYIAAGADVIITFNFACSPVFLKNAGLLDIMGEMN